MAETTKIGSVHEWPGREAMRPYFVGQEGVSMSDWRLRNDSTETLRKRLASWKRDDIPGWLRDAAPKVIADLEREIAEREGLKPLTASLEAELRALTKNTVIDRRNDRIEGDVGLGPSKGSEHV
jgi:hypothetical protein